MFIEKYIKSVRSGFLIWLKWSIVTHTHTKKKEKKKIENISIEMVLPFRDQNVRSERKDWAQEVCFFNGSEISEIM